MGDPRRLRKKYARPGHPWQQARMDAERVLVKEYGLRTKTELWKVSTTVKSFASQAKRLIALRTEQAKVESKQLLDRLARIGMLPAGSKLDDVLGLSAKSLLDRRLQTLVMKKGLARTPRQSRQFISHGHVIVGAKMVSSPSYIVPVLEEPQISFVAKSSLSNAEHPERTVKAKPKPPKPPRPKFRGRR